MSEIRYLSEQPISPEQIQEWVEMFHRDGCLFLEDVLTPLHCADFGRIWIGHLKTIRTA